MEQKSNTMEQKSDTMEQKSDTMEQKLALTILTEQIPKWQVPTDTNLEIECRYFLDDRKKYNNLPDGVNTFSTEKTITTVKTIISHALENKKTCIVDQSVNFLSTDGKVKQLFFIDGIQHKDKKNHYRKEKIIEPIYIIDENANGLTYRLAVTFEHKIPEFNIKECTSARIRLRFCATYDNWRIDITLVKEIENLMNPTLVQSSKADMLFPISIDNFNETAPWKVADIIEVECEYISDYTSFNFTELKFIDGLIPKLANITREVKNEETNDKELYQETIYSIAKIIYPREAHKYKHHFGLKQLSNQVIELDKNTFLSKLQNKITEYYLTDKVDGKRTIIFSNGTNVYALSDQLVDLTDKVKKIPNSIYILDTEEYKEDDSVEDNGKDGKKHSSPSEKHSSSSKSVVYYLFDILVFDDKSIIDLSFEERYAYFDKAEKLFSPIKQKPFIRLTSDYVDQIIKCKNAKKPYETDGFIFTPATDTYDNMEVYKYKPIDKLSIDFVVKKCPSKLLGIKPFLSNGKTLYLLFCGISKFVYGKLNMQFMKQYNSVFPDINTNYVPDYFPIQFEPSDCQYAYLYWSDNDKLDGEICEFRLIKARNDDLCLPVGRTIEWQLIRVREDRRVEMARGNYFGNNYKIAELIWMNYQNPLVIENITKQEIQSSNYFQEHDNTIYKASRNFNSYVKATLLEKYKDTEWTLDMASGKGQDLFRYPQYNYANVLFVEIDKNALFELISRKHQFSNDRKHNNSTNIKIQQLDLNKNYKENIEQITASYLMIPNSGFDIIVCNFALHYLIATQNNLTNVIKFIDHYLKIGGRFIFTAFDGQAIVNLLKKHNGTYQTYIMGDKGDKDNGKKIKYSIKKQYAGDLLLPTGQKIDVLLPFSNEEYYSEYLINISYVESEFLKYGIILEFNKSFGEFLAEYENQNYRGYEMLDADDKTYVSLYSAVCFYKKNTKGGKFKK